MANKRHNSITVLGRIIFISLAIWLSVIVALIVTIHQTGEIDTAEPSEAIVVLGAGLSRNGRPGWALTRRSSHAADLWHQGLADTIICTGGIADNQSRSEADGCREVLVRNGVPVSAILLEQNSRSTEENAIFTQEILQQNNFNSLIIVSDGYHLFRANYIFETLGFENVSLSPVSSSLIRGYPTYETSVIREVFAIHWQVFKTIFNIPITNL